MKIDDINKYFINNTIKVEPNHIQLITHCNEYHKLSVVGVTQKDKYNSNTYFGLHPILSPSLLQTFFINNAITDSSRFWGQIQEIHNANKDIKLCNFFDNKLRKIEFAFIGRAILRIVEHFSINLLISGTENELLALIDKINNLKNASNYYENYHFITHKLQNNQLNIKIKGFPNLEQLEVFNCYNFTFDNMVKPKLLINDMKGKSLKEFYADKLTFKIFNISEDYVYYSGVMPRVESIVLEDSDKAAPHLLFVKLKLGRTTFLTVDCFDNPTTLDHPYFQNEYRQMGDRLYEFDQIEDKLQEEFLYNHNLSSAFSDHDRLSKLNQYLSQSFNTHTLAVSANIVTSDGYLLIAKRSSGSIDSNTYYCSVNGQSEFYDENVQFYQNSVYEDLPTMHFDKNNRIDFSHEMSREAIAELGIYHLKDQWSIIGLSYLSINNNNRPIKKRRMHFNLLMENQTDQTFKDIYDRKDSQTESFEHDDLLGFKTEIFRSRAQLSRFYIKKSVGWILNQQIYSVPLLTALLILLYLFGQNNSKIFLSDWQNLLQPFIQDSITWLVISILIVFHIIKVWMGNYYLIFKKNSYKGILKKDDNIFSHIYKEHKNFSQYNVVARMLIVLHYRNMLKK